MEICDIGHITLKTDFLQKNPKAPKLFKCLKVWKNILVLWHSPSTLSRVVLQNVRLSAVWFEFESEAKWPERSAYVRISRGEEGLICNTHYWSIPQDQISLFTKIQFQSHQYHQKALFWKRLLAWSKARLWSWPTVNNLFICQFI